MDFKMPDIGEGVVEGEIVKWLVKEGDSVKEEQPLVEIMTDKATVEITSPVTGLIKLIKVQEGEVVPVETVIVVFDENGKKDTFQQDKSSAPPITEEAEEKGFIMVDGEDGTASNGAGKKVLSTPATRKFARDNSVDISKVKGSGPAGRVSREDVENHMKGQQSKTSEPSRESKELVPTGNVTTYYTQAETGNEERIPFRGLRKKISENLLKSIHNAPHFMIADEVDMTKLVELRRECKEMAEKKGVKLTYLPFIIKAVLSGLKEFPTLNSMLDEEKNELVLKKYYNVGVAVATTQGLIVPVVKNADKKSIFEISKEVESLAVKTRDGKAGIDDLKGGTFTVTNIGSIGGMISSPIINYPEVAILGVNKIVEKPVVRDGKIEIRSMMYLSMSCDHRIVDGAIAALFMNHVIELLQNPKFLLLE